MNETELTVTIDVVNVDVPADRLTLEYPGLGLDFGDKSIGKAISYAYKYALLKLFALETGDDPEKDNVEYPAVDYAAELTKYIGMAVDVDSLREAMSAFQKHYNISIQGDAGLLQMVTAKREEIERMSAIENSENRQNPPKQEEK